MTKNAIVFYKFLNFSPLPLSKVKGTIFVKQKFLVSENVPSRFLSLLKEKIYPLTNTV